MICPNCKTNLEGELIYETFLARCGDEKKAIETAEMYGATKTTGRWGREIALYDMRRDRTTGYHCPDCGHEWQRA